MMIKYLKFLLCFVLLMLAEVAYTQSAIYVGGHIRRERPSTISNLKSSGYTDIILFNIQVEPNGDLTTDGEMICTNGQYVFGNIHPNYIDDIYSLKEGVTNVKRIEACIGGWQNESYTNVRNYINTNGTGTNTNLYKNFQALKQVLPVIEAINNDDEGTYDAPTAVRFHVMLADIGFKTTIVPYRRKDYWDAFVNGVNSQRPGTVDRNYLQVYGGGENNNPCNWNVGGLPLWGGKERWDAPNVVRDNMINWKNNCGVVGGFIWVYNDEISDLWEYASSINDVFGVPRINQSAAAVFYPDCNFDGRGVDLAEGEYTTQQLQNLGINENVISSIEVKRGFSVSVYKKNNFQGESLETSTNVNCLVDQGFNDSTSSIKIAAKGVSGFSGEYYLRNRKSDLVMSLANNEMNNGGNFVQSNFTGADNQKFNFEELEDGVYKINSVLSGKTMDVIAIKPTNNANVHQWDYFGSKNQQFILYKTIEGFYQLVPRHSGRVVEVVEGSNELDANIIQFDNNDQHSSHWEIEKVTVTSTVGDININADLIYPNPAKDELFINKTSLHDQYEATIYDLSGKLIFSSTVLSNKINVSNINPGLYILKIRSNDQEQTIRFIKK